MKRRLFLALLAMAVFVPAQAQQEKLKIEFPRLFFLNTPSPPWRPGLQYIESKEETIASSRRELLVPAGVTNLAKNKPVSSSDKSPPCVGELSYITDGEKETDEGFEVELAPGPQWVQIDLHGR
ncbi:MAG: hypothetical protein LBV54_07075 [Puniceicoccales bacterium]|jgi:hypothetical protein|nr:hypothetical protein [Puniceicoccales bacterium]